MSKWEFLGLILVPEVPAGLIKFQLLLHDKNTPKMTAHLVFAAAQLISIMLKSITVILRLVPRTVLGCMRWSAFIWWLIVVVVVDSGNAARSDCSRICCSCPLLYHQRFHFNALFFALINCRRFALRSLKTSWFFKRWSDQTSAHCLKDWSDRRWLNQKVHFFKIQTASRLSECVERL